MIKERSNSVIVTFYENVGKGEIYDYFDSFGKDMSNIHQIPRLLLKRWTVDVPESKTDSYVDSFKTSELVLSAYAANTEIRNKKPSRFEKLNK